MQLGTYETAGGSNREIKRTYRISGCLHSVSPVALQSKETIFSANERQVSILKTKNSLFALTQIMFSIGTLAYSILFVTYETAVPVIVGWFGIVASIIYGLGNGIQLVKPKLEALLQVGGLLVLIFELILGGWLLIFS